MNSSSKALWLQESKQSVIGKREVQATTKMFARAGVGVALGTLQVFQCLSSPSIASS